MTNDKPRIKIHVSAPGVEHAMTTIFGVPIDTIDQAIAGDEQATKWIADFSNQANTVRKNLKPILKHCKNILDTTKDVNQARLWLLRSAAKNGGQIVRYKGQALVLDRQWQNFLVEEKQRVANNITEVGVQHNRQMHLLSAEHQLNLRLGWVLHQTKLQKLAHKGQQATQSLQAQADSEYQQARLSALQKQGSKADLGAIPRRQVPQLSGGAGAGRGLWGAVTGFFRGIGNFVRNFLSAM